MFPRSKSAHISILNLIYRTVVYPLHTLGLIGLLFLAELAAARLRGTIRAILGYFALRRG